MALEFRVAGKGLSTKDEHDQPQGGTGCRDNHGIAWRVCQKN